MQHIIYETSVAGATWQNIIRLPDLYGGSQGLTMSYLTSHLLRIQHVINTELAKQFLEPIWEDIFALGPCCKQGPQEVCY